MFQTREALITHITNLKDKAGFDPALEAATIKKYAGEIQEAQAKSGKGNRLPKMRVKLPAIFVLLKQGKPLSYLPDDHFDIYFVAETDKLDKEESERDVIKIMENYMERLLEHPDFTDSDTRYSLINLEETTYVTILNDHRHTIGKVPLQVSVDRA